MMKARHVVVGSLGVIGALAWITLLVAQRPRYGLLVTVLTSPSESIALRLSVLPSVLQFALGVVIVLPMVLASIGAMLGIERATVPLLGCTLTGLFTSASVVLTCGVVLLPSLGSVTGFRPGAGAALELVGAANMLAMHGVLVHLLTGARKRTSQAVLA